MQYSAFEAPSRRWLTYASEKEKPDVDVTSRWNEHFCNWDELKIRLPRDAKYFGTSEYVVGISFDWSTIKKPFHHYADEIAITGSLVAVLWGLLAKLFKKKPPTDGERE